MLRQTLTECLCLYLHAHVPLSSTCRAFGVRQIYTDRKSVYGSKLQNASPNDCQDVVQLVLRLNSCTTSPHEIVLIRALYNGGRIYLRLSNCSL